MLTNALASAKPQTPRTGEARAPDAATAQRGSPLPVFAISVPRFKRRYAHIRSHLAARFGDAFEIVGVDGADAAADAVANKRLTPGQVGCALSHLAVYKRMLERGSPYALVVEDDVVLPKNIHRILECIRPHLSDHGVVQLYNWIGPPAKCSAQMAIPVCQDMSLYYPMRASNLGSSLAYIIGAEAAKGILSVNCPVRVTADNWAFFFETGALREARILHPSPMAAKPFETTVLPKAYGNTHLGRLIALARRTVLLPLVVVRRRLLLTRQKVRLCDAPTEMIAAR